MTGDITRYIWRAYLAFGLLMLVIFVALPKGGLGQAIVFTLLQGTVPLAVVYSLRRYNPQLRSIWYVILFSQVVYFAANIGWYVYPTATQRSLPYPSFNDGLYFVAYLSLFVCLVVLIRRRTGAGLMSVIDTMIGAIGIGSVLWALLISPLIRANGPSQLAKATSVSYALVDILFVAVIVLLFLDSAIEIPAYRFVALGLTGQLIADLWYGLASLKGTFAYGSFIFAGWLVFYALFGTAVLHPSMREMAEPRHRPQASVGRPRLIFLMLIVLTLPVLNLLHPEANNQDFLAIGFAEIALTLLVFSRLTWLSIRLEAHAAKLVDRAALEEALVAQQEATLNAEQASRAKTEFVSRMSHELRTPLNAILGFSQLLALDELQPEQREAVDEIAGGGFRLLGLIDQVLDVSRIDAGRLSLSMEPVVVRQLVDQAIETIRMNADERGLRLEVVPSEDGVVFADPLRLRQVLVRLLQNAVDYNVTGGKVTVLWRASDDENVRIEVVDTGLGIPDESLPTLFVAFERGTGAGFQDGRIGLGLSLSKQLIDEMGGAIGVETKVGEGSRFWIELPAVGKADDRLDDSDPGDADALATVLYIEDNAANLRLVQRILLRRPGIRLLSTAESARGIELAAEYRPELILLDGVVQNVPATEILHRLRNSTPAIEAPVIVLTSDLVPGFETDLRSAGAALYLTKPLNVDDFLRAFDAQLAAQRESRA